MRVRETRPIRRQRQSHGTHSARWLQALEDVSKSYADTCASSEAVARVQWQRRGCYRTTKALPMFLLESLLTHLTCHFWECKTLYPPLY